MANTYVDYTATAGQTDFNFSFPYLEDDHVEVFIDGVKSTAFTISLSPTRVVLDTAATGGETIRVRRSSDPTEDLVDFVNGSILTESDLDRAYLHNRYLNEEAFEGNTSSLQTAAGSTNFDANFNKIINLAPPTNSLDAANKDYVDDKLAVSGTSLSGFNKSTHTGDNATTTFNLSFTPQTGTASAFRVAIDGVLQTPDDAYTIDSGASTITFTSAPPTNAEIVVIATGTAQDVNSVGVTATGSTQARSLADRFADVINVLDYGATGDYHVNSNPTVDDTTAIQNAINYAITQRHKPVYFPAGTYRLTSTITINEGIKLLGCGSQGSTESFGTVLIIDHAGNGVHFAGNSTNDYGGTGGGMEHFLIQKGRGSTSGAVGVLIDDGGAADDNKRHGEMQFNNILINGSRDASSQIISWQNCFYVDGSAYTTPGSSGIRSIVCNKFRCGRASENDKAIVLKRVVHFFAFALQIDTAGGGASPTGIWMEDCENVLLIGANINGRVRIPSSVNPFNGFVFQGRCSQFSNENTGTRGVFVGEIVGGLTSTTNDSNNLNIYSNEPSLSSISLRHDNDPIVAKIYPSTDLVTRIESQRPNGEVHIGTKDSSGSEIIYFLQPGSLRPGNTNGLVDLGSTGNRWDDLWSNGTFNGSDENIKQDIEDLTEAEKRVAVKCKALIKKYRLKDAFLKKGEDARIHVGIIAQELQAAFESEGLDAFRYSMIGKDTWYRKIEEDGSIDTKEEATDGYTEVTQMSVRYNELLAFIISAL